VLIGLAATLRAGAAVLVRDDGRSLCADRSGSCPSFSPAAFLALQQQVIDGQQAFFCRHALRRMHWFEVQAPKQERPD
jgi:hypothetical protein